MWTWACQCMLTKYSISFNTSTRIKIHLTVTPFINIVKRSRGLKTTPPHHWGKGVIKETKQIVGALLSFVHMVDTPIFMTLSDPTSAQAKTTHETKKAMRKLLDYCGTYLNGAFFFQSSDMVMQIHSYASYLLAHKARSTSSLEIAQLLTTKTSTAARHYWPGTLKNIMSSGAESKVKVGGCM